MASPAGAVVIGMGNRYRSDDAAGLLVARSLKARAPDGIEILEIEGEATQLIEAWKGRDLAVVVDAVFDPDRPGHVFEFDAGGGDLIPEMFRCSTHAMGMAEAVTLSRTLGTLPARLLVHGISGRNFEVGESVTPEVSAAVGTVARRILLQMESSRY